MPKNKPKPSRINIKSLTKSLKQQNIEGYLYIKATKIDGIKYTFCKFISPSLFMHMNNSNNINLDNEYSAPFLSAVHEDRKKTMVPFP
jgi:hypothetical protein